MKEDYVESKNWILRAIASSTTEFHFEGCQTLIRLFNQKYSEFGAHYDLQKALNDKIKISNDQIQEHGGESIPTGPDNLY